MNRNLIDRTITCVVGLSLLCILVFIYSGMCYFGLSILLTVFTVFGSFEMSRIIFRERRMTALLSGLLPISQCIQNNLFPSIPLTETVMLIILVSLFGAEILIGEKDSFTDSIRRCAGNCLLLVYPGYLASFIVRLFGMKSASHAAISLYILMVCGNDIFAYIFGLMFGKDNAGILKASPKKSAAGFIGGTFSCIAICLIWFSIFPDYLPAYSFYVKVLLGLIISISANIGDLIESVFKRSASIKDSGKLIPGRGGVLDSLDSFLSSAPVFYLFFGMIL